MIEEKVKEIIADAFMDDEIMATGPGRNMKFTMHFNSVVDPQYRNSPDILRRAYNEYKKQKGL